MNEKLPKQCSKPCKLKHNHLSTLMGHLNAPFNHCNAEINNLSQIVFPKHKAKYYKFI